MHVSIDGVLLESQTDHCQRREWGHTHRFRRRRFSGSTCNAEARHYNRPHEGVTTKNGEDRARACCYSEPRTRATRAVPRKSESGTTVARTASDDRTWTARMLDLWRDRPLCKKLPQADGKLLTLGVSARGWSYWGSRKYINFCLFSIYLPARMQPSYLIHSPQTGSLGRTKE